MSLAQLKNIMKLILNPYAQWMLNTYLAVIDWLWILAHNNSLINHWPSFQEAYTKDIWSYADQVRQEAACWNPRVAQMMTNMLFEELMAFMLSFPTLPGTFCLPKSLQISSGKWI
ncbi:hypothetical protein GYMLUDRAFT_240993 [Collybiopsis luxurians FD-317 M1]|nr:hypothetical protein GYMLUDRAFT_240993 [Collybiopsis luxurians FD-317 M1]